MNFLAHAVLAGNEADVVAGSAAGDFVKGVLYDDQYPANFLFGVRLHRRIDAFSNQQPLLRASADRLPKSLRRIGPPCIDMLADHFLARVAKAQPLKYLPFISGSPIYSASASDPDASDANAQPLTLEAYEDQVHQTLKAHWPRLSTAARRFFVHAENTRLFSSYAEFSRVGRGIGYVCERLGRATDSKPMVLAIEAQLAALEADFHQYWPALLEEASRYERARR